MLVDHFAEGAVSNQTFGKMAIQTSLDGNLLLILFFFKVECVFQKAFAENETARVEDQKS